MPMLEGGAVATDVGGAVPVDLTIRRAALRSISDAAEHARQIAASTTPADLRVWLHAYARQLGFAGGRYVHLGHALEERPASGSARPVRFLSTEPHEEDSANAGHWLGRDPVAARVTGAFKPFAWSAHHPRRAGDGPDGCEAGVAIPVQDYFAGPAYLALFGPEAAPADYAVREWAPEISFIAGHFHVRSARLLAPRDDAPDGSMLTSRQIDCLRLAALGHTAAESGDLLGLSFRGVEFHLHKAVAKFGARTKLTAVVRAVGSGLIDL